LDQRNQSLRDRRYLEAFILMIFDIDAVILWPRTGDFPPRIVRFKRGAVNVISGVSRTGKSAMIPIIDYCLGSDKCTIPVNTIRDHCEWFGVLVNTAQGQKLFARREPGTQRTTIEMFVLEGEQVEIPNRISGRNTTSDIVKSQLDDLAGLTSLDFASEGQVGFRARPSFRDLMAFTFQPQNVVANPTTLFYKADTYEHREKLRTIFPYVLGAITPAMLAKQHELEDLRKQLRRKQQELENVRQVSERFLGQLQTYVSRARELGLIDQTEVRPFARETALQALRRVTAAERTTPQVSAATIEDVADELLALREKESAVSTELAQSRQRFFEMTELRKSAADYHSSLLAQRDRLAIAQWLRKQTHEESDCPVCGNSLVREDERIDELLSTLESLETTSGHFQALPATFDREYQRVRSEMNRLAESLTATQTRLRALEQLSEVEHSRQYTEISTSRFVGRLESDLATLENVGVDSDLQGEVNDLARRIRALEEEVAANRVKSRLERALAQISALTSPFLLELDVERPTDPITLSITDLSVKVGSVDREDYLWEIGSGSNWLSYHVAVTLALQLYFQELEDSPVPRFLVYDQPSQVYFPKKLTEQVEETEEPEFPDEDVQAVRRVFRAMSQAIERSSRQLQCIVFDHVPATVWAGIPAINLVEDWRSGLKLVPQEWIAPRRRQ
jgi:Protein of unknown function (DUF3732)